MAIGDAERALDCEYYIYTHTSGESALRTPAYSLPRSIAPFVAVVAPTVMLHSPRLVRPSLTPSALLNTPKTLRELYGVGDAQGRANTNRQAVTAFLGQRYSPADFSLFQTKFLNASTLGYELATSQLRCRGDDGGAFPVGGGEAMLDAEYIVSLGANISTEFWGFGGDDSPPQRLWLKWMSLVQNTSDAEVPLVMSTSYGEDEAYIAEDYAARLNIEFMKAGVRGISLLVSSGDSGAKGTDPQTKGCPGGKFQPKWPTGSPYVTSVGGTAGLGPSYQTAADYSSGGFSDRWARPKWQADAVSAYLASAEVNEKLRAHINNTAGRGFPDVSALGDVVIISARLPMPVEGTSCSSPIFGGVVSLLNDRRLANGKPPLGFLNPFLYGHADALTDIDSGTGDGCKSDDDGFPAVKGWDAITGLGTPNFPALAKAVDSLP
jgi:tripeptidyl-peptidase-1